MVSEILRSENQLHGTNLYHRSKTANLDEYWLSCLWIISEIALAGFVLVAGFQDFFHFRLKALVEILHPVGPFGLSFCNIIKLLLYVCRKVVVHDVREVLHQEIVYHDTDISRQKLALFRACHLFFQLLGYLDALQGIYGKCALFARLVTLYYVLTQPLSVPVALFRIPPAVMAATFTVSASP